jgi:hypothetical protein
MPLLLGKAILPKRSLHLSFGPCKSEEIDEKDHHPSGESLYLLIMWKIIGTAPHIVKEIVKTCGFL